MRRLILTAAVALLVGHPAVASAHPSSHYTGVCELKAVPDAVTGQDTWNGVAHGTFVATDSAIVPKPSPATMISARCVVKVSGVIRAATAWRSGTGTVAIADRVTFVASSTEALGTQVCEQVAVGGESHEGCRPAGLTTLSSTAAYGVIRIWDDGFGFRVSTTYEPLWECPSTFSPTTPPQALITVRCVPPAGTSWSCPMMIVHVETALAGSAGGKASCDDGGTYGVNAGVSTGPGVKTDQGSLGPVSGAIRCVAYGTPVLVPPYSVTCTDPGVEGVTN